MFLVKNALGHYDSETKEPKNHKSESMSWCWFGKTQQIGHNTHFAISVEKSNGSSLASGCHPSGETSNQSKKRGGAITVHRLAAT